MDQYEPISFEEQLPLVQRAYEGDDQELRRHLSPLVAEIASRYVNGDELEDAEAAAFEALPTAVRLYTENSLKDGETYQFATYFTWHARRAIEIYAGVELSE